MIKGHEPQTKPPAALATANSPEGSVGILAAAHQSTLLMTMVEFAVRTAIKQIEKDQASNNEGVGKNYSAFAPNLIFVDEDDASYPHQYGFVLRGVERASHTFRDIVLGRRVWTNRFPAAVFNAVLISLTSVRPSGVAHVAGSDADALLLTVYSQSGGLDSRRVIASLVVNPETCKELRTEEVDHSPFKDLWHTCASLGVQLRYDRHLGMVKSLTELHPDCLLNDDELRRVRTKVEAVIANDERLGSKTSVYLNGYAANDSFGKRHEFALVYHSEVDAASDLTHS